MYLLKNVCFLWDNMRPVGYIYNHPDFEDGDIIRTSEILSYDKENQIFTTISGNEYRVESFGDDKVRLRFESFLKLE